MTAKNETSTLASFWSAPALDGLAVGAPVACFATTYTFDAQFLETELLPRFLGLKFDNTERDRAFIVEREQGLGTARTCVLVDQSRADPGQSTLRWDQLPVRVPGGCQHAKITLLAWERLVRLIVSSANLTRSGYRKNREIAGVMDFYDDCSSTPLRVAVDVVDFLSTLAESGWIRAASTAIERCRSGLSEIMNRLKRWRLAPMDFTPREIPRVFFVSGLPPLNGRKMRSVMDQTIELWGDRKAEEVAVMTPFVGEDKSMAEVVNGLVSIAKRTADTFLAIPGTPSEQDKRRMVSALPKSFRDIWASAWNKGYDETVTCIVPLRRKDEEFSRNLHAKAIYMADDQRSVLLCGSSNFTPHGMGVGAANIEANLFYIDDFDQKRGGQYMGYRLPVDWEADSCDRIIWEEAADTLPEDVPPSSPLLPAVFLSATYNQREAKVVVYLDSTRSFPAQWSLCLPGRQSEAPLLAESRQYPSVPRNAQIQIQLPGNMLGVTITCLLVTWTPDQGEPAIAYLPVQVETLDDLLPPEEFRSLSAAAIIECLISGQELAEIVDADERSASRGTSSTDTALESLRSVDTSGFVLYRVRRFGRALAALGERLHKTLRTLDAMAYRLHQDPFGPCILADALVRESTNGGQTGRNTTESSQLMFSMAELSLTVAFAGKVIHSEREAGEADLRPLLRRTISDLLQKAKPSDAGTAGQGGLRNYVESVKAKCCELLGGLEDTSNAD